MEEKTKKGLKIGGGAVVAVGVVAAVVHWWPSGDDKPGEHGHGHRGHGKGPHAGPHSDAPPHPMTPSPQLQHVSPSTAQFVPGALRIVPLVRRSLWHAFPPGAEVVTVLRSGHYVQFWIVGPDGVTLTAMAEPVRATPDLVFRAEGELRHAHLIGPYAHRDHRGERHEGHREGHHEGHHDRRQAGFGDADRGSSIALAGVLEALSDPRIGNGTTRRAPRPAPHFGAAGGAGLETSGYTETAGASAPTSAPGGAAGGVSRAGSSLEAAARAASGAPPASVSEAFGGALP